MTTATISNKVETPEHAEVREYVLRLVNEVKNLSFGEYIQDAFWIDNGQGKEWHSVSVLNMGTFVFFFGSMPMTLGQAEQYILSLIKEL